MTEPGAPNMKKTREGTRAQDSEHTKAPGVEIIEYTGTKQRLSREHHPQKVRNIKEEMSTLRPSP
jgi:hypothetical protein